MSGAEVQPSIVESFNKMYRDMRDDPWAWCEPPSSFDSLDQYAPLTWWYEHLDLASINIPRDAFIRMKTKPLSPERQEEIAQVYNTWSRNLKHACD